MRTRDVHMASMSIGQARGGLCQRYRHELGSRSYRDVHMLSRKRGSVRGPLMPCLFHIVQPPLGCAYHHHHTAGGQRHTIDRVAVLRRAQHATTEVVHRGSVER